MYNNNIHTYILYMAIRSNHSNYRKILGLKKKKKKFKITNHT